ncbi:MAG: sigma-54-dependent Fis family transcriptional regulator, partial [Myxococcales bacterium]|nr:sigma-54-dependent Fis family transcriptional regulator [Myxococcales bacterium]
VLGLVVTLPGAVLHERHDGRPNGFAWEAFKRNLPYRSGDASRDPNYARYFFDVASILAVPIPYQRRAIGVISVSSPERDAFSDADAAAIGELAAASAKFLRRAQLYRATRDDGGRPFLIKGLSQAWLEVERRIEQVAPTVAPVLIHGESGTGKDLVARATHFNSLRSAEAFVTVNCAAIPETMLESVLFGHVKGAFTGASFEKVGEFQKAHKGTLFLDELGELPMALQAKVLRAVEQGEIQPLGSNKPPERVDVRLISATNRDLRAMCKNGQFREDLYFRLSVISMELPALRTYKAHNLETMAQVFLQQAVARHRLKVQRIAPAAMEALLRYDYPGNVRELKNTLEHAAIMARGAAIEVADLPTQLVADVMAATEPATPAAEIASIAKVTMVASAPALRGLRAMREEWLAPHERRYLMELLAREGGSVRIAAERAGINTVTMYRLLRKRGIVIRRQAQADCEEDSVRGAGEERSRGR